MWAGIGFLVVIALALFAFGSLGIFVGGRIGRRSNGSRNSNNEAAFFWIFGGLGVGLVVWLLKIAFGD